ncbi:hypothetical protein B0H10DRAFT_1992168 [Mycena sp. CBHHK59/15]|nr:hypothetical protein B0H10DRAFT_1992168 [Mycena sp. CBHHK59/15]
MREVYEDSPRETSLHFRVKSRHLLKILTTDLKSCESRGWLGIDDSIVLIARAGEQDAMALRSK